MLKGWYFYPNLESWLGRFYTHKSLEYPFAMSNTDPPAFLYKICIMYVWVHVLFTVSKWATCALSHLNSISILNPNKGFPIVRIYLSLMFPVVCCMWEKTLKTALLFIINNITMLNLQRYVFPWTRKTCYSFIVALHQRHFKVFFIYLLFTLGTVASFVFCLKQTIIQFKPSFFWLADPHKPKVWTRGGRCFCTYSLISVPEIIILRISYIAKNTMGSIKGLTGISNPHYFKHWPHLQ